MKPNSLIRNIKLCWIYNETHPLDQFIIDLVKNITFKIVDNKSKVWYNSDGQWIIRQVLTDSYRDKKNDFYIHEIRVFSLYEGNDAELKDAIKFLLEKHLKCEINQIDVCHWCPV